MPKTAGLALPAVTLTGLLYLAPLFATFAVPVLAVAAVAGYRRALTRRPYTGCRPCRGTGFRLSRVFADSRGRCPDCTGTGRRCRPGTRLLNVR